MWGLGCGGAATDDGGSGAGSSSGEAGDDPAEESSNGEMSSGGDEDEEPSTSTSTSTSTSSTSTSSGTSSGSTSDAGTSSTTGAETTSTTGDETDGSETGDPDSGEPSGEFVLTSTAFDGVEECAQDMPDVCDLFPPRHVSSFIGGENVSPPLAWTDPPAGTASFVLVFHDLTNTMAHWAMWNIPADFRELPEGLPSGAMPSGIGPNTQQVDFLGGGDEAFFGSGARGNVYEFALYALDVELFTPADSTDPDAVQDEIEASASLLGSARLRARSNPSP